VQIRQTQIDQRHYVEIRLTIRTSESNKAYEYKKYSTVWFNL